MSDSWKKFLQNTHKLPPTKILVECLDILKFDNNESEHKYALDIGCGAFKDTLFLLENNFIVDCLDDNIDVVEYISEDIKNSNLFNFYHTKFTDFKYTKNKYTLINAQNTLPFSSKEDLEKILIPLHNSLQQGGYFTGTFFGMKDDWNGNSNMNFINKNQAEYYLKEYKIIKFTEYEGVGKTTTGQDKK